MFRSCSLPHHPLRVQHPAGRILCIDVVVMCVLAALIVASWLPRMQGPLDFRWDGGVYYVLGTAIAEGKGYRLLNEPGEIEAVQYPPLLPAIIAIHQLIFGTNDWTIVGRWLRLSFFFIFVSYIACSYLVLRKFLPRLYAFGAALMTLLNFFTNFLSDVCFAEIPFALVTMLFVLSNRKPGRLYAILTGMLAMAAYLLRTVGIALLMAWVCESLFNRQYRKAATRAVFSVIPILVWNGYIYSVESSPSYKEPAYAYQRAEYLFYNVSYAKNVALRDPFAPELGKLSFEDLARRFLTHLTRMPVSLGEGLSAKTWYWQRYIVMMTEPFESFRGVWRLKHYTVGIILPVIGSLICVGMILLIRQGEVTIPVYLVLVLIAVCLTPWPDQWPRYWTPTVPFLALCLFRCILPARSGSSLFPQLFNIARPAAAGLVALIFLCQAFTLYMTYVQQAGQAAYLDRNGRVVSSRLFFYKDGYRELDAGLDWLMTHAQAHDIVAASMPQWVYLRTGLKSIMPPFERDLDKMQTLLDSVPVTYVVVDTTAIDFGRNYTVPLLKNSPHRWSLVHTVPQFPSDFPGANGGALEIYKRIGQ